MTTTAQRVRDAVAQLRNTVGGIVGVVEDSGRRVSALAASGRLVVSPGETIGSAWGNTTYDQTTQVFNNAADRDNQWPAPKEGARCYLLDTHLTYLRHATAWHEDMPYRSISWQSIIGVASTGGCGPIAYPGGPFKAGSIVTVYVFNADQASGWAGAAIYQQGTNADQFSFNPYTLTGALMPNNTIRCNVLAIGEWPE